MSASLLTQHALNRRHLGVTIALAAVALLSVLAFALPSITRSPAITINDLVRDFTNLSSHVNLLIGVIGALSRLR